MVRITADTIALSPPLIIERVQIDELVGGNAFRRGKDDPRIVQAAMPSFVEDDRDRCRHGEGFRGCRGNLDEERELVDGTALDRGHVIVRMEG